jgi:(p)ppGpp synthase/HD superfamily hydrolase
MTDEATTVTALLHDIVKNTDYTFERLLEEGFDEEVVTAIRLLTHPDVDMTEEAYMEYIEALKQNPIARAVKIADLEHNSDLSRYGTAVKGKDIMRAAKYQKALVVLQ